MGAENTSRSVYAPVIKVSEYFVAEFFDASQRNVEHEEVGRNRGK